MSSALMRQSVCGPSGLRRFRSFRAARVPGGLRLQKRASVAPARFYQQQSWCNAACAQAADAAAIVNSAVASHDGGEEDDTALRFLGFISACGEALSSVMPPNLVSACYALAVASVVAETASRCREHVRANWVDDAGGDTAAAPPAAPAERDVLLPGGGLGRRVRAAKASRRAIERGAVKLITTVALPTLIMHGITHSGWDMFTDAAGVSDALQSAAGHLAHVLHLPHHDICEALGRAVPNLAGSFLMPMLAKPAERLVEKYLHNELRPAIDEFMSRTPSRTLCRALSRTMSRSGMTPPQFSGIEAAACAAMGSPSMSAGRCPAAQSACASLTAGGVAFAAAAQASASMQQRMAAFAQYG